MKTLTATEVVLLKSVVNSERSTCQNFSAAFEYIDQADAGGNESMIAALALNAHRTALDCQENGDDTNEAALWTDIARHLYQARLLISTRAGN